MPKKKGLGRDIDKSIEIMSILIDDLRKFTQMPLKKGLSADLDKKERDEILKMTNDASEVAVSLSNKIDDLKDRVKILKPKGNSRFAHAVITRFLTNND